MYYIPVIFFMYFFCCNMINNDDDDDDHWILCVVVSVARVFFLLDPCGKEKEKMGRDECR